MKKLFGLLCVVLLSITLTACSSSKPTSVQEVLDLLNSNTGNYKMTMVMDLGMLGKSTTVGEVDGNKIKTTTTTKVTGEDETVEVDYTEITETSTITYSYDETTETWSKYEVENDTNAELEYDFTEEDFVEDPNNKNVYILSDEAAEENGTQLKIDLSDKETVTVTVEMMGLEFSIVLSDFDDMSVTLPTVKDDNEEDTDGDSTTE